MKTIIKVSAAVFALVIATASSRADDLYNNLVNSDPNNGVLLLTNNQPLGQHIYMDSAALSLTPYLTNFTFEYYSSSASFVGVSADVKFYLNNSGTYYNGFQTPGSIIYDTGWFPIYAPSQLFPGTNYAYASFGPTALYSLGGPDVALSPGPLPQDFTVVYTIQGLSGSEMIGLPIFNPPTTGTNYGDYWLQDQFSNWSLVTNNVTPVAIGMQFEAAPEPSVIALGALGGLLMTRLIRRKA